MKAIDFKKPSPLQEQYLALGRILRLKERTGQSVKFRADYIVKQLDDDSHKAGRNRLTSEQRGELLESLTEVQRKFTDNQEEIAALQDQRRLIRIALAGGRS